MDSCDVLIVGGGPGGAACAWSLRLAGLDVVVLDKKVFPRDKICAGWVTPPVMETLEVDLDDYRRGRVLQPITGFRSGLIGGAEVETRYERPVSYGIRRCEFDHYLLQRSGARLRLGQPLKSLELSGGRWVAGGAIAAPLLVGAGGHFCPVARRLGARHRAAAVVAAQEGEFEATPGELEAGTIEAELPEIFFCRDLAGYGWCFRKGNFLNIGLGRVGSQPLASHVSDFCQMLKDRRKVRCELPGRFHGHAYQLYERTVPKLLDEQVLLVGDAAGLAYPQSGEGIRPAVESGLMAAEVILQAEGRYERPRLEPYRERIEARFGKPRSGSLADRLPAAWLRFAAARLLASRWFSRHVVLQRWFLHMDEPALASPRASRPARLRPRG